MSDDDKLREGGRKLLERVGEFLTLGRPQFDAIQRPRNYNHTSVDGNGEFTIAIQRRMHWVTVSDPPGPGQGFQCRCWPDMGMKPLPDPPAGLKWVPCNFELQALVSANDGRY